MNSSNKVLILGGSGLLGINMSVSFAKHYSTFFTYNQKKITLPNTSSHFLNLKYEREIIRIIEIIKPKIIINCAGITSVEYCEYNTEIATKINTKMPDVVSKICEELQIKLIHISTDHLYDGCKDGPYSEDDSLSPINFYALTKAEAEKAVLLNCKNSLILRTNFFGWSPTYRESFSDFIINGSVGNILKLFSDVQYSPISIPDLINATHRLIEVDACGIFNLACDESLSKFEFGQILLNELGLNNQLNNLISDKLSSRKELVRRPINMALDNDKLQKTLGRGFPITSSIKSLLEERELIKKKLFASI